jgi:hypothetical protein
VSQTYHTTRRPTQYINPAVLKTSDKDGCKKCGGKVFDLEKVASTGSNVYHKQCLSCDDCRSRLDSTLVNPYEAPDGCGVFCKRCFAGRFGEGGKQLTYSNTAVITASDGSGEFGRENCVSSE